MPGDWEGAKVDVPLGVYPLFLTGASAAEFGLDVCTVTDPYRMINRESLLKSIQFKGKISDFYVVQKEIDKYKGGDDIMICLDDDEIYGQNFFMCITEEECQRVVAEEEAKAATRPKEKKEKAPGESDDDDDDDDFEEVPYEPPVSKPWVSLGSEAEIEEEAIIPTRERFVVQFQRKRREFGAVYRFSDRDSQDDPNVAQNDCRQYKDPNFELRKKEHDIAIQACPEEVNAKTQTTWFRPANKCIQYESIDLPPRQKMDALDSDKMVGFLAAIRPCLEEALQQNETVDIFGDEFADLADGEEGLGNKMDSDLKELHSFYHLSYCLGRNISYLQWQSKTVVGTAGSRNVSFDDRVASAGKVHTGFILLWSFSDPINPQYVLEAPGDIYCFRFCPTNSDVVIGGLESGQVAIWNLAEARTAAREAKALTEESAEDGQSNNTVTCKASVITAVDSSHKKAITDLVWMPPTLDVSEKGRFRREEPDKESPTSEVCYTPGPNFSPGGGVNMFLSVAGDGQALFWDMRKSVEPPPDENAKKDDLPKKKVAEGWVPTAKMPLLNPDGGYELSPAQVCLEVPDDPTGHVRLYAATEEGEFTMVELMGPAVEGVPHVKGVKQVVPAHTAPCVSLQRSPFLPALFLSVGDWTFDLWMEGVASPLFVSPFCSCLYTCGAWSPSRAAVLFLGRSDGFIDIWDLNDRSHEPSMTVSATPGAITSMEFHVASANKQLLAVGDDQGTVHVMEIPRILRRPVPNEKAFAANFFGREEQRVLYVEKRKKQRAEEKDAPKDDKPPEVKEEPKEGEEVVDKLELAFLAYEELFKEEMGLNPPPEGDAPAADAD